MTRLYVKPGDGRAVPDPEHGGELLPAEGRAVPNTAYWQRRVKDQDVVLADPPVEMLEPVDAPDQTPAEPKTAKRGAAK